jgi:leishmanolysin
MFGFLVISLVLCREECGYEFLQLHRRKRELSILNFEEFSADLTVKSPFRVDFDLGNLRQESNDSQMCKSVRQVIVWNNFTYLCTQEDLMTTEVYDLLNETFMNLTNFLHHLLKVQSLPKPIIVENLPGLPRSTLISNADLHVSVAARPFPINASISAAAIPIAAYTDGRPVIGIIFVNPRALPVITQSNRQLFMCLLHEMLHILGMSRTLMEHWINPENGKPYSPFPMTKYHNKRFPNKTFDILHTPSIEKYAMDRFNITEFVPGVPAGVELQDTGGSETVGNHPSSRVFLDDVSVGVSVGTSYLSNLTLALLEDTGWYDVDHTMAEPLAWGDGRSRAQKPLSEFPRNPPYETFPSHYLCWPNETKSQCSYDFLAKAKCHERIPVNCTRGSPDYDKVFCQSQEFYNPRNFSHRGKSPLIGFMAIKIPEKGGLCNSHSINLSEIQESGETYGPSSICLISTLNVNSSEQSARPDSCIRDRKMNVRIGNEVSRFSC